MYQTLDWKIEVWGGGSVCLSFLPKNNWIFIISENGEGFPGGSVRKESACNWRRRFNPWVGKIHWRRKWQPTPLFLPGEFLGQRSLAGYSPWGHRVRHNWETHIHTHTRLQVVFSFERHLQHKSMSIAILRIPCAKLINPKGCTELWLYHHS